MKLADYILLMIIAVCFVGALVYTLRRRKSGGCMGCGSGGSSSGGGMNFCGGINSRGGCAGCSSRSSCSGCNTCNIGSAVNNGKG